MATEIRTLRGKLSNRTINALVNKWGEGVTLEDAAKAGAREMLKIRGFGRAALRELRPVLREAGLTLAHDDVGLDDVDRAILAECEACKAAVAALAEDKTGDLGADWSGGWEAAIESSVAAIRARGAK